MNAKVCDRCGSFYKYTIDRTQMPGIVLFVEDAGKTQALQCEPYRDLCPRCFKSLTDWYNNAEERETD